MTTIVPSSGLILLGQLKTEWGVSTTATLRAFVAGGSYVMSGMLNGSGSPLPTGASTVFLTNFYGAPKSGTSFTYSTPGSYSFVVPGNMQITIEAWGGGGAGGVSDGVSGTNGNDGTASQVIGGVVSMTANGGLGGGGPGTLPSGGSGGTASGGVTTNTTGSNGGSVVGLAQVSGAGGNAPGGGGTGGTSVSATVPNTYLNGNNGTAPGAGGSGAAFFTSAMGASSGAGAGGGSGGYSKSIYSSLSSGTVLTITVGSSGGSISLTLGPGRTMNSGAGADGKVTITIS